MSKIIKKLILFGFITSTAQAYVTLGTGVDCDFTSLQAAYLDNDPFVRVTTQATQHGGFVMTKAKWFTGGYATCADADAGIIGADKTIVSPPQNTNKTTITVNANSASVSIVIFDNFDISSGQDVNPTGAGGVKVTGNSSLIFNNSVVRNSLGQLGGGIQVSGIQARLTINNTTIRNNIAETSGGGIYCDNQAQVSVLGDSSINSNLSHGNGGGIYATTGCQLTIESGDTNSISFDNKGITNNTAIRGGGIYMNQTSTLMLSGNSLHPANIVGNFADESSPGNGGIGGGIFLADMDTEMIAINARIEGNNSVNLGAGICADNQARFSMYRQNESCWDNERCSSLSFNISTSSGYAAAAYIGTNVVANISQTNISNNIGNNAALFSLSADSNLRLEGNLITQNKGLLQPSDSLFILGGTLSAARIDFLYNTITNNDSINIFKLNADSENNPKAIYINNSIIWDTGNILAITGDFTPVIEVDCTFVHELDSLVGDINLTSTDDPLFMDPVHENYHLSTNSTAIDFCDEFFVQSQYPDLNGNSRGFDVINVNNTLGSFDAGAYEVSTQFVPDIIFLNDFE